MQDFLICIKKAWHLQKIRPINSLLSKDSQLGQIAFALNGIPLGRKVANLIEQVVHSTLLPREKHVRILFLIRRKNVFYHLIDFSFLAKVNFLNHLLFLRG